MVPTRSSSGLFLLPLLGFLAAAPVVLDECDDAKLWAPTRAPAKLTNAAEAKFGPGAIQVTLPGEATRTLSRSWVPGSAAWDATAGLSFWVKGDGSENFSCLAVVGAYSYAFYFPLKDTQWHQVTATWAEFAPEGQTGAIGGAGGMPPSAINAIRVGTRWTIFHNNQNIPPHSFSIDRIQLEEKLDPPAPVPPSRDFKEILALLKEKKPLRIQCMGDSITAGTSLVDRERSRYAVLSEDLLRRWTGNTSLVAYSRAVGGARSTDQRAWVPRDFVGPTPDLMTLWIGYNDKSGAYTREYYKQSVNDYLDRVARFTRGRTAFLLIATGPGCGARFTMMDDYAEVIREIGRERKLPVVDMNRALKALGRDAIEGYFADMAHPNEKGHRLVAETLCEFLVRQAGFQGPMPAWPEAPAAAPVAPKAPVKSAARLWDFEAGLGEWTADSQELSISEEKAASGKKSIRFDLKAAAKDHRRAFSPAWPVKAGESVRLRAQCFTVSHSAGDFGLFAAAYETADGSGPIKVLPVKRGPTPLGAWARLEGAVEIPAGIKSLRAMIWAPRDGLATFFIDDVAAE
ncbi:MAG: SGNH/GDSL hydrolase family protein [Spirochaetes bacterium]|nr:SGNH/GDSL hydrolase family protein [Spirochaetota bacterium]